jgi:chromosome segregation ATPase
MTTRLEAAQGRQENLLGRIDSRIGKLKELKANTVALDRQVASLEQTLTQQAALIAAITPNLDKALSDTSSTEYFNNFKESVNKAVAQITTTQATLNKLFEDLKSLSARISPLPISSASPRVTPSASVTSTLRPSPSPRSSAEE